MDNVKPLFFWSHFPYQVPYVFLWLKVELFRYWEMCFDGFKVFFFNYKKKYTKTSFPPIIYISQPLYSNYFYSFLCILPR